MRPDSVRALLARAGRESTPTYRGQSGSRHSARQFAGWLGAPVRWARAMPSPVARSGRGLTALAFDRDFPPPARREVRDLFARSELSSKFPRASSTRLPSLTLRATVITLWRRWPKRLRTGTGPEDRLDAAAHALADGILAWRESEFSLDELLREAATPGGIAAATLASMDRSGYKRIVRRGLRAGMGRAKKNANG